MLQRIESTGQPADKVAYFKHRPSGSGIGRSDDAWTGNGLVVNIRSDQFAITNDFPSASAPGVSRYPSPTDARRSPNASAPRSPSASVGPAARDYSQRWHL
jgi:hypothetical protein